MRGFAFFKNYMEMIITAKNNPKIKEIRALLNSSRERKESGLFVLEGVRLCCDALKSGCEIQSVFCTEGCYEKNTDSMNEIKNACLDFFFVSGEVLKSISDTVTPQGVVCTVKISEKSFDFESGKRYIALDTIQNPDNLGAISRTAEAFGIDGMVVFGGCDIYNPKALRASMGAIFRLPIKLTNSLKDEIKVCRELGISTFAAVPDGTARDITKTDFSKGALCVIGNEGNGIRAEIINECQEKITVKMRGRAESLNAASAAAVIMWELIK